jgi:NAD(P)-dependent dehydrogenase (short-subunit alcohol dehydrogenase family)
MPATMFASYPSLKNKVVLITGGAAGIGASFVDHFWEQGARVAFLDSDDGAANELVERLGEKDPAQAPLFVSCDVRNVDSLRGAIERVADQLGTIQVLISNAARDDRHPAEQVSVEYWDERLAVNLRHHFFAAQAVRGGMKAAGGGSIINLGSISWMLGQAGYSAYTTAKAAIHGLTRCLAREFGVDGIRVNEICPGWVMTQRQISLWLDEAGERELLASQCLKKKVYPADVARMALFLAADDACMCTGQRFIVDAGWA